MKRGDGNLYITFNEMGHGDCILICLPNGKMVLIDCGSMRWDRNYWEKKPSVQSLRNNALFNAVGDARYLLNKKIIDLLILTHSDKDHHSELQHLFDTSIFLDDEDKTELKPPTSAEEVFFSGGFHEYGTYNTTTLLTKNGNGKAERIYSVTIDDSQSSYQEVLDYTTQGPRLGMEIEIERSADGTEEILKKSRREQTKGFVKVLDGTHKNGIRCGFYLLASNVTSTSLADFSDQANRGSLVTMIVYGDKKFLFTGDATRNTERFLLNTYGDRIKDVELVQAAHHASDNTSSSEAFVEHVNPRIVAVSAAYNVGSQLALPRYEVLKRYNACDRLTDRARGWKDTANTVYSWKYTSEDVVVTDSKGRAKRDSKGNKIIRKDIGNFPRDFVTRKQIWCTGSHGAVDFIYKEQNGRVVFQE